MRSQAAFIGLVVSENEDVYVVPLISLLGLLAIYARFVDFSIQFYLSSLWLGLMLTLLLSVVGGVCQNRSDSKTSQKPISLLLARQVLP